MVYAIGGKYTPDLASQPSGLIFSFYVVVAGGFRRRTCGGSSRHLLLRCGNFHWPVEFRVLCAALEGVCGGDAAVKLGR
ncbi:hypothetical protein Bca4012_030890 [Brassica carinata]|uniref:(rape) hypothetical protein n=1 Tax=Brassica napus TaxID=3708 RepID=A0A816JGR8_BRANA|nr:unnamed protein product [Brassica napus]